MTIMSENTRDIRIGSTSPVSWTSILLVISNNHRFYLRRMLHRGWSRINHREERVSTAKLAVVGLIVRSSEAESKVNPRETNKARRAYDAFQWLAIWATKREWLVISRAQSMNIEESLVPWRQNTTLMAKRRKTYRSRLASRYRSSRFGTKTGGSVRRQMVAEVSSRLTSWNEMISSREWPR